MRLHLDVRNKVDDQSAREHNCAGNYGEKKKERDSIWVQKGDIDGCKKGATEPQEGFQHSNHCSPAAEVNLRQ